MPALNFMKRFVPRVESGLKTHSIRAKRKRAWKVGDKLSLFTGMRQRGCQRLGNTVVVKVEDIEMDFQRDNEDCIEFHVIIDGEVISFDEAEAFAKRDGFTGIGDMAKFWVDTHALPFAGDVIHWKYPFEVLERKAVSRG